MLLGKKVRIENTGIEPLKIFQNMQPIYIKKYCILALRSDHFVLKKSLLHKFRF